jgi:hypothetical protein
MFNIYTNIVNVEIVESQSAGADKRSLIYLNRAEILFLA